MINEHQKKVIRSLKGLEEGYFGREIPIINDRNITIGSLRPIDSKLSNDEVIISSLARWRQIFMHYFLTQFEATNERTRKWLSNVVIKDNTRILFLIMDGINRAVGNLGICNISRDSAEIDNLIRGEGGGDPKLVFFSEVSLIYWIYNTFSINNIYLHVFSNNLWTILFHESVGFVRGNTYRLTKKENHGEIYYTVDYSSKPIRNEFGYMKMVLDKHEFLSRHPWLEESE